MKQNNQILIDKKNYIYLESAELSIGHILSKEDADELIAYYKKIQLNAPTENPNNKNDAIYNFFYYVFKDKNNNIFGDTFMLPLNKTGTVALAMPLLEPLPNEKVYKNLFEFMCYAAKRYSYKRLVIPVSSYEEYSRLLDIGFLDMPPEHADKMKMVPTGLKNDFKGTLNDFFSVQIDLSKMPETELGKTAVISKI